MLIDKGSVQEFLAPVLKKGQYQIVSSMSLEAIEQLPDLSKKTFEKKKFGFGKGSETEIQIGNQKITPSQLKQFGQMELLEELPQLQLSNAIPPTELKLRLCPYCKEGKKEFSKVYTADFGKRAKIHKYYAKCDVCNGKYKSGYSFKDFAEYVSKFNEKLIKINKEIAEIRAKGSKLVEEYNSTVATLNQKFAIWNRKCPSLAIDNSSGSEDDFFKYWKGGELPSSTPRANTSSPIERGTMPLGYGLSGKAAVVSADGKLSISMVQGVPVLRSNGSPLPSGNDTPDDDDQSNSNPDQGLQVSDDPLTILKKTLAEGKISIEEYEKRKKILTE